MYQVCQLRNVRSKIQTTGWYHYVCGLAVHQSIPDFKFIVYLWWNQTFWCGSKTRKERVNPQRGRAERNPRPSHNAVADCWVSKHGGIQPTDWLLKGTKSVRRICLDLTSKQLHHSREKISTQVSRGWLCTPRFLSLGKAL